MPTPPATAVLDNWRAAGLHYYHYNYFLRQKFGGRVQKVSIDAGFTCPNVDGTVATGGCTFCDNRSFSPSRRLPRQGVLGQIDEGIRRLKWRYDVDRFLAYFQPATNTYAPVERLRPLYEEALAHPQVVGLAIGTRPDCVPDDVLDLLADLGGRTYLSVEYGLQTIHDRSLDWMNRGHHYDAFLDAMERSRGRGFEICAHVMLGLPGESHDDMMATARELARMQIDAVKIHNLYAVNNTPLADQVARGEVTLMGRDEYVSTLVDFIEMLPPSTIIERISGEAPPQYFIGPAWSLDKPAIRAAVEGEFARRDTWQGKRCITNETDIVGRFMQSIIIDGPVGQTLESATGHIEVRNQDGRVIGFFLPATDLDEQCESGSPCSIEQLDARSKERGGQTTAEVLRELEKLQ